MPHTQYEWQQRVKNVEREFLAIQLAMDRLMDASTRDPSVFSGDMRARSLREAAANLDGTYLIRLFAEFETCLRLFWPAARPTDPPSRTRDLIDGIAATCRIPNDRLMNAHEVRDYRNSLVHLREKETAALSVREARGHLCRFLSHLPPRW